MKLIQNTLLGILTLGLVGLTGCGSQKTETAPPVTTVTTNAPAKPVVEAVQPLIDNAAKAVTETANAAVAEATNKANELIAQAKTLISQSKFTDALNTLQQLSSLKLTPEQEQTVAGLKDQIQKALAATSAAGTNATGLLNQLLKK
jgi:hypothetical protein